MMKNNNYNLRGFAFAIDVVLTNILIGVMYLLIKTSGITNYYIIIFASALPYALFITKDSFTGQSIGKMMFNLQIVNDKTNLPVAPWRSSIRSCLAIVLPIALICGVFGRRRPIDYLLKTNVIQIYQRPSNFLNWHKLILFVFVWSGITTIAIIVNFLYS